MKLNCVMWSKKWSINHKSIQHRYLPQCAVTLIQLRANVGGGTATSVRLVRLHFIGLKCYLKYLSYLQMRNMFTSILKTVSAVETVGLLSKRNTSDGIQVADFQDETQLHCR